jgi:penicillin-binding protein-related factor A (putative recombinase)
MLEFLKTAGEVNESVNSQHIYCVCVVIFTATQNFFLVIIRKILKGCQIEETQNETLEVEKLRGAADGMQSVAESFSKLTLHEITSDIKSTVSGTSK